LPEADFFTFAADGNQPQNGRPDSTVHAKRFEDTALSKISSMQLSETYRSAIIASTILRIAEPASDTRHTRLLVAKSLDVIRPGGVMAVITSRFTMDKLDSTVRRHLADGSTLLGALRLPNTASRPERRKNCAPAFVFIWLRVSGRERPNLNRKPRRAARTLFLAHLS